MNAKRLPVHDAETKAEIKRVAQCPGKANCKHCVEREDYDMCGERYECFLCGDSYYLDYENMK